VPVVAMEAQDWAPGCRIGSADVRTRLCSALRNVSRGVRHEEVLPSYHVSDPKVRPREVHIAGAERGVVRGSARTECRCIRNALLV
jgi:hypothetical protein